MALTIRGPGITSLLYQLFYFAEAGLLAAHLKRRQVTHIHNHAPTASGYVTMIAAAIGQVAYSMTLHGFGIFSEPRRWQLKEKLERAAFVVCVSHHARSQAMLWSNWQCWNRFHVVHCGVRPTRTGIRVHSGLGTRLIFVGRLDSVKGLPVLLSAVNQLRLINPRVHLDIVGDGPARPEVEHIAHDLRLTQHVTFHGYLPQSRISHLYRASDIAVMSSFAEGIPVVLMEAMNAGLPVVAPHITGIPELIDDGVSGYLTPPGDSEAIASRVDLLLRSPEMRTKMGQEGQRFIRCEFNIEHEVTRLVSILTAYQSGDRAHIRPRLNADTTCSTPLRTTTTHATAGTGMDTSAMLLPSRGDAVPDTAFSYDV